MTRAFFLPNNTEYFSQEHHVQQDLVEFEHEKQVAETRGKSTPEKVLYFAVLKLVVIH